MKKTHGIITVLLMSTLSYTHAATSFTSHASTAKTAAMKQFNESLERFKRCIHGKCTKMEALKALRDVGIAATLVITILYVIGETIKQGSQAIALKTSSRTAEDILTATYTFGKALQKPVTVPLQKAKRMVRPFKPGDEVHIKDDSSRVWWTVKEYNKGNVTIEAGYEERIVPASEVELIPGIIQ